MNMNGNIHR
jgi:hypothetical protein